MAFLGFGILLLTLQLNAALLPGSDKDFHKSLPREVQKNSSITIEEIQKTIGFAYAVTDHMKRLEQNIQGNVYMAKGSPNHGLFILYQPDEEAVARGRGAMIASKVAVQLLNTYCSDKKTDYDECFRRIRRIKYSNTLLQSICDYTLRICSREEYNYPYRTYEGFCNNIVEGGLGEAFTGYTRVIPPKYSDDIHTPRRAHSKKHLPSAREISSHLIDSKRSEHNHLTMAVLQWAQFLEHDLSRFATSIMMHFNRPVECCGEDGSNLAPRYKHPFCSSITVPTNDKFYSMYGVQCMSYVQSLPSIRHDCSLGPNEQINQATHYLDGSQLYGSISGKVFRLRRFVDGKLQVTDTHQAEYLPLSPYPTEDCQVENNSSTCFSAGDPRVNFLPHLTVMHTLWAREHNRIAEELASMNGYWDDEKIFQETRKIVVAEMQHITYNEWLDHILGSNRTEKIHKTYYDEDTNPSVSNSFATAVLRSFMSMIPDSLSLVNERRHPYSSLKLHEHFNKPGVILKPRVFDEVIRGATSQMAENIDNHYARDLTNKFCANGSFGYDVLSLDIERGRDHGLPGYNKFRRFCGLKMATTFSEFNEQMTPQNARSLSEVYDHPDDVDLIIGGLMEKPEPGSLLGPTFSCLMEDQLLRTRKGDRYFYSNNQQPTPFTAQQLKELRNVSLARIICDNANDIRSIQPRVFERITKKNKVVRCDSGIIPRMDLTPWRDNRERYSS